VLLSAATGQLWADAAARLPGGPRSWWIGFVVNALIFALSLWAIRWVPVTLTAAAIGGFGVTDLAISLGGLVGTTLYVTAVPLVVAAAAMVWRRRQLPTPPWLVDGPAPPTALGHADARPFVAVGRPRRGVTRTDRRHLRAPAPTGRGRAVTDEDRVGRYLFWLMIGMIRPRWPSSFAITESCGDSPARGYGRRALVLVNRLRCRDRSPRWAPSSRQHLPHSATSWICRSGGMIDRVPRDTLRLAVLVCSSAYPLGTTPTWPAPCAQTVLRSVLLSDRERRRLAGHGWLGFFVIPVAYRDLAP
jgi:hypothetical protein